MKKILSYILIAFVIVNLFAPLSVGVNQNKVIIQENTASAESQNITLTTDKGRSDTTITVYVKVTWGDEKWGSSFRHGVQATISGEGINPTSKEIELVDDGSGTNTEKGQARFTGLKPNTTYSISSVARSISTITAQWDSANLLVVSFDSLWGETPEQITKMQEAGILDQTENITSVTTLTAGQTTSIIDTSNRQSSSTIDTMPECGVINGTISGCIAQILYYLLFIPTSYIFALAGNFFDFTFAYSVNDASYRSTFVVQGWGVVRDLCNMFFIFVLLYVAFKTILGLNVSKTKEMIINVIIIGIMINFSLFATQLIIDASNILARVFYNSNVIKINVSDNAGNGVTNTTNTPGPNGEIQLSAALVNKVNPQNLIINASQVGNIPDKGGQTSNDTPEGGVTTGTFILVTLLASAVNIIGLIVFISVGLIFVARVIGLWMAMIFVPFTFFSYTVPDMQGMNIVGWKHWWPETLKLAFLAPIFIFFLYLILKFLETGLGLPSANDTGGGISFVIATIVPFVFIMALLWKAKDLAKSLSGSVGQTITGGVAAVGGLALGGAALGAAALGRNTIGSFMKGASTGESSNQRFAAGTSRNMWDKIKGGALHYGTATLLTKGQQAAGKKINTDQKEVEGAMHARHTLDQNAQTKYHKKYNDLTGDERVEVKKLIDKNILSRQKYGNKTYAQLTDTEQGLVDADYTTAIAVGGIAHGGGELEKDARKKQGLRSSIMQASRSGSYDVRNLSTIVAGEQDKILNKFATGLTSSLAKSMRGALGQANLNYGAGQKDIFKDLGNTISEALKSATIKVDLSHVGKENKEDSHGGGGHH